MIDFREEIAKIIDGTPGGLGGILLGSDGIAVDSYQVDGSDLILDEVGAELSALQQQARVMNSSSGLGNLQHFWIVTDQLKLLSYPITEEYFIALIFSTSAYIGQTLFNVRMTEDGLRTELE